MRHHRSLIATALLCSIWLASPACVDEDTNSATGSTASFSEAGGAPTTVTDESGSDGVTVDCSSLFTASVSLDDGATGASVSVSFPAGAAAGDRFVIPVDDASIGVVTDGVAWDVTGGVVIVDQNQHDADLRIAVTLTDVVDANNRTLSATLDCLETAGDTTASSCASACRDGGGGGGGGGGFDD